MIVNRDTLIADILTYKKEFFAFIDYIKASGSAFEFPQRDYILFYNKHITPLNDKHLQERLSIESLYDSGIFNNINHQSGMLVLSSVVYELLVFLDVSRSKQLTLAQFESLRKQMVGVVTAIQETEVGSDDHQDYLQLFYQQHNLILTTVRENIAALHNEVDLVAERYRLLGEGSLIDNIDVLYTMTHKLSERFVQPCLEFIDPHLSIVNSLNFTQALDQLEDFYRREDDTDKAIDINYKKRAVLAYYKDVEQLSKRLRTYLYNLSEQRTYFMAIEHRFNQMTEIMNTLRHGGGSNIKLRCDLDSLSDMTCFDGLSSHKNGYASLLNRDATNSLKHFKHYFEQVKNAPLKQKVGVYEIEPLPENVVAIRKNNIMQMMAMLPIPNNISDIYLFLHDHLLNEQKDFMLMDVLHGLEFLLPLLDSQYVKPTTVRSRIEDDHCYFDYSVLSYQHNKGLTI